METEFSQLPWVAQLAVVRDWAVTHRRFPSTHVADKRIAEMGQWWCHWHTPRSKTTPEQAAALSEAATHVAAIRHEHRYRPALDSATASVPRAEAALQHANLTDRQRQALQARIDYPTESHIDIAERLGISRASFGDLIRRAFQKTGT